MSKFVPNMEGPSTVWQKARAFDAIERLARAGHGPTFSQQAVWLGQSAAMGYGKTSEDFAGAILAIEKTGGGK